MIEGSVVNKRRHHAIDVTQISAHMHPQQNWRLKLKIVTQSQVPLIT